MYVLMIHNKFLSHLGDMTMVVGVGMYVPLASLGWRELRVLNFVQNVMSARTSLQGSCPSHTNSSYAPLDCVVISKHFSKSSREKAERKTTNDGSIHSFQRT